MLLLKERRITKTFVAWLLVIAMFFCSCCIPFANGIRTAYAADSAEGESVSEESHGSMDNEEFMSDEELLSLDILPYDNEQYVIETDNEDGTTTASIYNTPIRYKDENGDWVMVNNNIKETGNNDHEYKNDNSDIEVLITEDLNKSNAILSSYKEYSVAFKPLNILTEENESLADIEFGVENQDSTDTVFDNSKEYDSIIFKNTFNNETDIKVTPTSTGVKEDIILNVVPLENEFSYELTVTNVIPKLRRDGNVYFVDEENNLLVGQIPAPFMYDSSEEEAFSYDINVELEKVSNDKYLYRMIPDRSFLEDEDRVYPVVLDPTYSYTRTKMSDTFIYSDDPASTRSGDHHLKIGNSSTLGISRGLVKFFDLGDLVGENVVITEAIFAAYQDYVGSSSPLIGVYEVTEYYNNTNVNWEDRPTIASSPAATQTVQATGWYEWDITDLVQNWYESHGPTYDNAICIKNVDEGPNKYKRFRSENNPYGGYPVLNVTYESTLPNIPAPPRLDLELTAYNGGTADIKVMFDAVLDNPVGSDDVCVYDVLMAEVNDGAEGEYSLIFNDVSPEDSCIKTGLKDNQTYRFRIQAFDEDGNASPLSAYTEITTYDKTGPIIEAGDITMSSQWTNDTTIELSWSDIGDEGGGTTELEYRINNGLWNYLGKYDDGTGIINCGVLADGPHEIKIRAKDREGNISNVVDLAYNKDTTKPSVAIVLPSNEAVIPLPNNTTYSISASASDLNIVSWSLDYGLGVNPAENDFMGNNIASGTSELVSTDLKTWDLSQLEDNRMYTLRLTAIDEAGNAETANVKVLYAIDTNETEAYLALELSDSSSQDIGVNDDITVDSVEAVYTPSTDMLGKLYANDEQVDAELPGDLGLVFNPLEYDAIADDWVYPEGSQVFLRVMAENSSGDFYFTDTTYEGHKVSDIFDDNSGIENLNNTILSNSSIKLTESAGVYSTAGSIQSTEQRVNGLVNYVTLTVDETKPANTGITYKLLYGSGSNDFIILTPNTQVTVNLPINSFYLKAEMTSDTSDTPSLNSWHLDMSYVPFGDSTVIENSFVDNARGFCNLDHTSYDESNENIRLSGITYPIVSYDTSGSVQSTVRITPGEVWEVYLGAVETKPVGTDIAYQVSADGGVTWQSIARGTDPNNPSDWVSLTSKGNEIVLKATLTGDGTLTPELDSWTLKCRQTLAGEPHDIKLLDEPDKLSTLVDANHTTLLRWEASETAGVTYRVYRSENPYFTPSDETLIGENISDTYWNDCCLDFSKIFYYKVTAVKEINSHDRESLPSNEAWAITVSENEMNKMLGLQNYWSYSGFKAGTGTGYVNVANGNVVYKSTDMVVSGPFYGSVMSRTLNTVGSTKTPLGYGWDYGFNTTLIKEVTYNEATGEYDLISIVLKDGDGSYHRFLYNSATKQYSSAVGTFMNLTEVKDVNQEVIEYKIERKDGITYHFDAITMKLDKFSDLNGKVLNFNYDSRGNLCEVINSVGEKVELEYSIECQLPDNADEAYVNEHIDMINTVMWSGDNTSIVYEYNYNDEDQLESVIAAIGSSTPQVMESIDYDADLNDNGIKDDVPNIAISDAEGRITVIVLDSEGKAISVYEPVTTLSNYDQADHCTLDYDPDNDQTYDRTTVTTNYGVGVSFEYDTNGLLEKKTDPKGNSVEYEHNSDYLVTSMSYDNTLAGDSSPTTVKNVYTYNSDGNITKIKAQSKGPGESAFSDLGPETTFTYDTTFVNKIASSTVKKDSSHTVTTAYKYDVNGNIESTKAADGSTSDYYDPTIGGSSSMRPIEKTTSYEYYDGVESGGFKWQLKSVFNEFGKETRYIYDTDSSNGTLDGLLKHVEEYDPDHNYVRTLVTYNYDSLGRTSSVIGIHNSESIPNIIEMKYDEMGRLEQTINPDYTSEKWTYDKTGRLETHYVGRIENKWDGTLGTRFVTENATSYEYDLLGRLLTTKVENDTTTSSDDITSEIQYLKWDSDTSIPGNDADKLVMTDAEGTKSIEYYDILGRLIETKIYDGTTYITTAKYKYDDIGNMIEVKDSANRVSRAYYDELNRQIRTVVDPFVAGETHLNIETLFEYDCLGNTTKTTQRSYENSTTYTDYITSFEYDDLSRLVKTIQPNPVDGQDDLITRNYYDVEVTVGNDDLIMNYTLNPIERVTETYFDKMGYKVMMLDRGDKSDGDNDPGEYMKTLFEYDLHGRVEKVTHTDGTFKTYDYDKVGRPLKTEYFEQGASSSSQSIDYAYNDMGQVITQSMTDGDATHDTSYGYDRMGRTTSVWEGTYDNGEPSKVSSGLDVEYEYNKAGQIVNINYNTSGAMTNHNLVYTYDDYGRADEIRIDPVAGDNNTVRKYVYNSYGEIDYVKDYRGFNDDTTDYIKLDYVYNSAGLIFRLIYSDAQLGTNGGGITERYSYWYDGRGFIDKEKWEMDYSTTESIKTVQKDFEYDSLGRLIKASSVETPEPTWDDWDNVTEYTYDSVGNRKSLKAQKDTDIEEYKYTHTQFNQIEEVTKKDGTEFKTFELFEYDTRGNQTVKYSEYDDNGDATKAEVFTYNLLNQLMQVATPEDVTDIQNDLTMVNSNVYNAGGQRIKKTEYLDNGRDGTDEIITKYFYSGSSLLYTTDQSNTTKSENIIDLGGRVVASWRERGTGNEEVYFYNYDVRGSTTAIVASDGNSEIQYAYDEFGNMSAIGSFDNEITFTSSISDTSTGLQYMNARYYNPTTGSFITQDSYTGNAYQPWTQHLYSYCANNPTNFVDPTGHTLAAHAGGSGMLTKYGDPYDFTVLLGNHNEGQKSVGMAIASAAVSGLTLGLGLVPPSVVEEEQPNIFEQWWQAAKDRNDAKNSEDATWYEHVDYWTFGWYGSLAESMTRMLSINANSFNDYLTVENIGDTMSVGMNFYMIGKSFKPTGKTLNGGGKSTSPGAVKVVEAVKAPTNRGGLRIAMGDAPFAGAQAHHGLPWKFKDWFAKRGLNVNNPSYGAWVKGGGNGGHQSWSKAYNEVWHNFILEHKYATPEQVLDFYGSIRSSTQWGGGF